METNKIFNNIDKRIGDDNLNYDNIVRIIREEVRKVLISNVLSIIPLLKNSIIPSHKWVPQSKKIFFIIICCLKIYSFQ